MATELSSYILTLIFGFIFGIPMLMLTAKMFGKKGLFLPSLKITSIAIVVSLIINLSSIWFLDIILFFGMIILNVYLIKRFFKVEVGNSIGIFVVWTLLTMFAVVIFVFLLTLLFGSLITSFLV